MHESSTCAARYVVGFFDLLGQSDRLGEAAASTEAQRHTWGAVRAVRQTFARTFHPVKSTSFSDSVVVFLPVADQGGSPSRSILGILSAAAIAYHCALREGHPLRGGIDLGFAMETGPEEIYGPALLGAYTLESQAAQYPRIVIGDDLIAYLNALAEQSPEAPVARECLECLAVDHDGHFFLDHLGPSFQARAVKLTDSKLVEAAYTRVVGLHEHFKRAKDTKLAFRYTLLRHYFEARLPGWRLAGA